jgi:hypothetical protein
MKKKYMNKKSLVCQTSKFTAMSIKENKEGTKKTLKKFARF